MKDYIAVLDLGTNTFHLLIIEPQADGGFKEIYRERRFVKIGLKGVGYMGKEVYDRALNTLIHFGEILKQYKLSSVWAIATEGLRKASNSDVFIQAVKEQAGIDIQCISGDTEALLIYYGVRESVKMNEEKMMIMDIGGGSVEFIIAAVNDIFWKQSFPIGSAVLRREFHQQDPIQHEEVQALETYLYAQLQPLLQEVQRYKISTLIGASGAFDTLASIVSVSKDKDLEKGYSSYEIDLATFTSFKGDFLKFDLEKRKTIQGMEPKRADMIVVSYLLIDFILTTLNIQKLVQTNYAIKEGIIWSVMNDKLAWVSEGV